MNCVQVQCRILFAARDSAVKRPCLASANLAGRARVRNKDRIGHVNLLGQMRIWIEQQAKSKLDRNLKQAKVRHKLNSNISCIYIYYI